MDSLDWTKLKKTVRVFDTRKRYFKKYFSNIKYYVPGGRIIMSNDSNFDIEMALESRKQFSRNTNYGGSWRMRSDDWKDANVKQLTEFRDLYQSKKMFFRIEEPNITIYSVDEKELYDLATGVLQDWRHRIVSVTRPANQEHIDLLNQNAVLMKTDIGYRYKIVLRDGKVDNRDALRDYLDGLEENVKISRGVRRNLERNHNWLWGIWFYVNDPDLITMLNLIEPGIVANIHETVVT